MLDSMNSTRESAPSNSLAEGEDLVAGSKVPSNLLKLGIRQLVLRCWTSRVYFSFLNFDVVSKSPRCKSYCSDRSTLLILVRSKIVCMN